MKKEKLIACSFLPAFWMIYFLFELITGRVKDMKQISFNIVFIILFALVGYILYTFGTKLSKGLTTKSIFLSILAFIAIDQGVKLTIKKWFFDKSLVIIKDIISFDPIINTQGSWLNARFAANVSFIGLIIFNFIGLFFILEIYRYCVYKNYKCSWLDFTFIFMFSGAVCSLIDKLFYGGSLDFIGIIPLFIADIKDIYLCIAIFFIFLFFYITKILDDDKPDNLSNDFQSIKMFFIFIKDDIIKLVKLKK